LNKLQLESQPLQVYEVLFIATSYVLVAMRHIFRETADDVGK
jgi:hypothetical protein